MSDKSIVLPEGYADWLNQLKTDISHTQQKAVQGVNRALVQLYHHIGQKILQQQQQQGWGAKVIERLASDLRDAFPHMRGWSSSNLKYMRFFAQQCPSCQLSLKTDPAFASKIDPHCY